MTPAIALLQQQNIAHEVLSYEHSPNATSYGLEAADKLYLNPAQVFKTLVTDCSGTLVVALVPVTYSLNLKALAKAIGTKKACMASPQMVQSKTGYVLGGVSPLGQKTRLKTVIDQSARALDQMYVSAGKRGLEVALRPADLSHLCSAQWLDITI